MALSRFFLLFAVQFFLHIHGLDAGICQSIFTTIEDIRRSTAYRVNTTSGKPLLCDRGFIKDDTWYRFDSPAGSEMPTTKPDFWRCGTYAPIWMDGSHPQELEKPVSRKACVNLPYVQPIGCGISFMIQVIKCKEANVNKEFYLYQLKDPGYCSLAYCAGSTLPVHCSTTGDTLPVCPGVVPDVTNIKAVILKEANPFLRLKCVWEYNGKHENHVHFHVRWFGDESDLKHKIDKKFDGTAKKEFLLEWELSNGIQNKSGYQFNKQVFCQVRAQYIKGTWSKWKSSNRYFTGISVYPQFIRMSDCGVGMKREVVITLRPHLPIRGKQLLVDLWSPRQSSGIDSICVRGDGDFEHCGITFRDGHQAGAPLRFKIMTTCPIAQTEGKKKLVQYLLQTRKNPTQSNTFWNGYVFPSIKIFKTSNGKRECKSTGDPHFTTFDGKYFDFYGRGTFTLYQNDYYGTEIQVRHRACWTTPSCNCGVAIKEHAFFKIYDMCYQDIDQAWWKGKPLFRFSKHCMDDHKLNRFYEHSKSGGSSSDYEVSLPSGVVVTVTHLSWGLNLLVSAPIDIKHPSKGLCGNNNGKHGDDLNGKTPDEFGESLRVRTRKTLFDYEGDKFLQQKIVDRCDEKLCICKKGATQSICYDPRKENSAFELEVLDQCFPSLQQNSDRGYQKNSNIGECEKKIRKRDLGSRDDTVDDQDVIPPFDPPITNITFVPEWPTPLKRLTQENVTSFCNRKLRYSQAGKTCGKITGVNIDTAVQQCITDIQITEDFSWSHSAYTALEADCITNVYKNESMYKNNTDGKLNVPTDILASVCPGDCSDHGTCKNSTCTCEEDYTAADCSIALKDRPVVFAIRKSGLCDVRRRPCTNVGIYGFPFLDSENLTCHVQEYKVIQSAWTPQNTSFLYPGYLADLTEVRCLLPASPVNIGDYDNEGVTAAGLRIAVSNNRINASEVSMKFITFDSTCQECNTTAGCKLKKDACFILGHCFAQNQSNPREWCEQCLPEISSRSWTRRQDNQPPTFQISTVLNAFYGKRLRAQLRASDPENRLLRFTMEQNSTTNGFLTENGFFTWIPRTNYSTSFTFKVYDECGLHDIINTSVVIKQCPCKNDGRCQPDSKDLNGSGNFTCSCNYGYTGIFCELDIDECLSTPCANGTCKNNEPGFSCSCNPGYTGLLCDIDIDECLQSPCFLRVPCYDRINGYQCGPCPKGYSGNGEICNRNDGKIDECIKSPDVCHQNASCMYNKGSYSCQCVKGYSGDGKTNCTDIDECSISPGVCHANAICTNFAGSYSCQCALGYSSNGSVNCTDINECAKSPFVCHRHAVCKNSNGSYSCQCSLGYSGDGKIHCTEIDECIKSPDVCHQNASCMYNKGSYSCQCVKGYSGDGKTNCTDIDECSIFPGVCHANAICTNFVGSYSCQCALGYSSNGSVNCTDLNECAKSPFVCHQHAVCKNSNGSYSCQCSLGYSGDGKINCTDINECIKSSGVCHKNATCRNSKGSYSCQCKTGYTGDGMFNCTDINECGQAPAVCHSNGICTNAEGSYSCKCARGFIGNGKVNCKENIPPRFSNPSKVYAILNKHFQILIKAVDPENQHFTYSLLVNGTIKNAQLSRDGLLTILVKETGSVSIRVEDDLGAQRVLTLQVIAILCLCKNGGECKTKISSLYPEHSTDYICQCVAPYVGEYCESRHDPCQKFPCFPGLECSPINDKFICEECPKLFQGDGIKCELKPEAEKSSYKTKITLKNEEWNEELTNKDSMTYKKLVSRVTSEIKKVYSANQEFSYVIITGFRQGSVIVEFEIIFTNNAKDPLEPLQEAVKNGKLGNMTAEMEKIGNKEPGKQAKILGLDLSIFIVVVVAAGLLIIVVSFVIYRKVKRARTHRDEQLPLKTYEDGLRTQPKGVMFRPLKKEAYNVLPSQEIGLVTFEKKAIDVHELQETS